MNLVDPSLKYWFYDIGSKDITGYRKMKDIPETNHMIGKMKLAENIGKPYKTNPRLMLPPVEFRKMLDGISEIGGGTAVKKLMGGEAVNIKDLEPRTYMTPEEKEEKKAQLKLERIKEKKRDKMIGEVISGAQKITETIRANRLKHEREAALLKKQQNKVIRAELKEKETSMKEGLKKLEASRDELAKDADNKEAHAKMTQRHAELSNRLSLVKAKIRNIDMGGSAVIKAVTKPITAAKPITATVPKLGVSGLPDVLAKNMKLVAKNKALMNEVSELKKKLAAIGGASSDTALMKLLSSVPNVEVAETEPIYQIVKKHFSQYFSPADSKILNGVSDDVLASIMEATYPKLLDDIRPEVLEFRKLKKMPGEFNELISGLILYLTKQIKK
jgi:hypothetical protein